MKKFNVVVNRTQTMSFEVMGKDKSDAIDRAIEMAYDTDWSGKEAEYSFDDISEMEMCQRKKEIVVGENIYDAKTLQFCTVRRIINTDNEQKYEVYGQLKSDKKEKWIVSDEDAYQIVPNLLCHEGHILCYEHNSTSHNYPYYCPFCDENLFGIETIQINFAE